MPSILINLTPFVSGLEDKAHNDDALWPRLFVRDAKDAVVRICALIDRPITGVTLRAEGHRTDFLARVQGQASPVPLATLSDGLTPEAVIAAHQAHLNALRKPAA
ncbi:MAG: hypothetical protein AAGC58_12025 [Asticcacaulis sp.]